MRTQEDPSSLTPTIGATALARANEMNVIVYRISTMTDTTTNIYTVLMVVIVHLRP